MGQNPQPPDCLLGGFEWLDTTSKDWPVQRRRKWFAGWWSQNWLGIYQSSLRELCTTDPEAYNAAIDGMSAELPELGKKLAALSTTEQLHGMAAHARKFRLETTRDRIESELEFCLRHSPETSVVKVSPWSNARAVEKRSREEGGFDIWRKQYPRDPDLQFALRRITAILSAAEISDGLARAPLRERRDQRALFLAVRTLITPKGGPDKLADGLANFLRLKWPKHPHPIVFVGRAPVFDAREHFGLNFRGYRLPFRGKLEKRARAERVLVRAIITREELWRPMLLLAEDAIYRKKGWEHLRNALATAFAHIARTPSDQRKVTDTMIRHWPEVREMLQQNQAASLASILNTKLKLVPPQQFGNAPEGKSSVEVQIRRGRKQLKRDYDLD